MQAYFTLSRRLKLPTIVSLDKNISLLSWTSYFESYHDDFYMHACLPLGFQSGFSQHDIYSGAGDMERN